MINGSIDVYNDRIPCRLLMMFDSYTQFTISNNAYLAVTCIRHGDVALILIFFLLQNVRETNYFQVKEYGKLSY